MAPNTTSETRRPDFKSVVRPAATVSVGVYVKCAGQMFVRHCGPLTHGILFSVVSRSKAR